MDIAIIGAGPAGLTAGMYAGRAGISCRIFERMYPGGKLVWIEDIENFPGFPEGITGRDLAEKIYRQTLRFKVEVVFEDVIKVEAGGTSISIVTGSGVYDCRAVIVASGSIPRKLGVPGEEALIGRGVSYCALCDGYFFRNKTVAVVGEGKRVLSEIEFLRKLAKVVWVTREKEIPGDTGVTVINGKTREILGTDHVSGIVVESPSGVQTINVDGVFIFAGFKPSADFLPPETKKDAAGFLITDQNFQTSVKGIFACGDIRAGSLKQAVSACSEGAQVIQAIHRIL
jgi:thioredoxin reductase (NADPH)